MRSNSGDPVSLVRVERSIFGFVVFLVLFKHIFQRCFWNITFSVFHNLLKFLIHFYFFIYLNSCFYKKLHFLKSCSVCAFAALFSILTVRTSCPSRRLNWIQFNLQNVSSISSIAAVSSTWSVCQCAVLYTCCEALCFRCAFQDGYDWWRAGHALKACLITASLWWQQDLQAPLDSQMCSTVFTSEPF